MAEFNGKNGHWVTSNGRHIFISDDPTEKQEREIKAQEEQTKKLTIEKQEPTKLPFGIVSLHHLNDELSHFEGRRASLSDIQQKIDEWGVKEGYGLNASKNFKIVGENVTKYGPEGEVDDSEPMNDDEFEDKSDVYYISTNFIGAQSNEIDVFFGDPTSDYDEDWENLSADAKRYYRFED